MDFILNKYYEYFLKGNFEKNVDNVDIDDDFYSFYCIIINKYDIENDQKLKKDLEVFQEFFKSFPMLKDCNSYRYWVSPLIYRSSVRYERIKNSFEKESVSFKWFDASCNLRNYQGFIFSYPSSEENWAKVYLSIKPEKYIETIIKLQKFIDYLDQKYFIENVGECKFRTCSPANDAIVMRFCCKEHYEEFLRFLDENKDIKESFDTPNLFLPQDEYGLSIITDEGGSYNYFVARMIWDYMFLCRDNSKNVNVHDLVEFIQNYDTSHDKRISENGNKIIEDFKYVLISKLICVDDKEIIDTLFGNNGKKRSINKE